ncbi:MAG: PAS domain-containing protein [Campylobacterota bacterium]|nr:PAS domain-containing protein [Campylobacterota bacterium]
MEYNESEFLFETDVPEDELIVSRTDLKGIITYANDLFVQISGFSKAELIGKNHNIVRHPDMPEVVFSDLWKIIKDEKKWNGNVKNIRKDKGFYWVNATISGVYKDGKLVEYKSIRVPISEEEKLKSQKEYDKLKANNGEKQRHIVYK